MPDEAVSTLYSDTNSSDTNWVSYNQILVLINERDASDPTVEKARHPWRLFLAPDIPKLSEPMSNLAINLGAPMILLQVQ